MTRPLVKCLCDIDGSTVDSKFSILETMVTQVQLIRLLSRKASINFKPVLAIMSVSLRDFVCVDALRPSQQVFGHVESLLNQYLV